MKFQYSMDMSLEVDNFPFHDLEISERWSKLVKFEYTSFRVQKSYTDCYQRKQSHHEFSVVATQYALLYSQLHASEGELPMHNTHPMEAGCGVIAAMNMKSSSGNDRVKQTSLEALRWDMSAERRFLEGFQGDGHVDGLVWVSGMRQRLEKIRNIERIMTEKPVNSGIVADVRLWLTP